MRLNSSEILVAIGNQASPISQGGQGFVTKIYAQDMCLHNIMRTRNDSSEGLVHIWQQSWFPRQEGYLVG